MYRSILKKKIVIFVFIYIFGVSIRRAMSAQNSLNMKQPPIQSTAGAVPIRNEKGKRIQLGLGLNRGPGISLCYTACTCRLTGW